MMMVVMMWLCCTNIVVAHLSLHLSSPPSSVCLIALQYIYSSQTFSLVCFVPLLPSFHGYAPYISQFIHRVSSLTHSLSFPGMSQFSFNSLHFSYVYVLNIAFSSFQQLHIMLGLLSVTVFHSFVVSSILPPFLNFLSSLCEWPGLRSILPDWENTAISNLSL